jgi:hypothetical protein
MVYEKQEKHHNIQNVKNFKNMSKPEIHPMWFPNAPVICEGKTLSILVQQNLNYKLMFG